MKKNLEYYQHHVTSHNHPKFKMLRLKYGWEGEGKFWALNNMIAASENCKLNLNKGYNKAMVSFDLGFKPDEFEEYLQYLTKDCKLIRYKKGIISTDNTQENYKTVHADRLEARNRYLKKTSPKKSEVCETSPEKIKTSPEKIYKSNQTKVNKTKVNKTKSNQTKVKEKISEPGRTDLLKNKKQEPEYSLNGNTDLFFNKFWNFYNRREGDQIKIRKVFIEVIRSEFDYRQLITATRNYNNLTSDRELKYMKMPINFLQSYKDYIKINN